jgi:hypothetical protein
MHDLRLKKFLSVGEAAGSGIIEMLHALQLARLHLKHTPTITIAKDEPSRVHGSVQQNSKDLAHLIKSS